MVTTLIEPERAAHITSSRAERASQSYLAAFLLVVLVLYLMPFAAERIPSLQRYSASDWGRRLDYTYTLDGANADVVIFGDSSALYGIDTTRLSAELHVKAVNLPQSIGSLVINGDTPLRHYLEHNKPPRIIVSAFTPWNRDFRAVKTNLVYEGTEQLVRHGSAGQLIQMLGTRPADLATFPLSFYLVHSRLTRLWKPNELPYSLHSGFEPYPLTAAPPLSTNCTIPPQLLIQDKNDSLLQLRSNFSHPGTKFVTIVAPVPQCKHVEQLQAMYGSALAVMPFQYFADDTMLAHVLPFHVDETTDRVAAIVRAYLPAGPLQP